jgi:hypothetical protein
MLNTTKIAVLAALLMVAGCKKDSENITPEAPTENSAKYTHEIDILPLLGRVLDPTTGDVSEEFLKAVGKPATHYTDFYGYQALRLTSAERIKRDFVPKYAQVLKEDANTLELKFNSGWTGKFYINTAMKIKGYNSYTVPVDHFYAGGETFAAFLANLEEFRGIIKREGWESTYLIPNPDYALEVDTENKLAPMTAAPILRGAELQTFPSQTNALILVPDTHGNLDIYNQLYTALENGETYDWFALEMMSEKLQGTLDTYLSAPEGSEAFLKAKKALLDYYDTAWNQHFKVTYASREDNHYFRLIDLARRKGKKVYALEKVSELFFFFRYGEDPFGLYVRNNGWAKNIPAGGRGVVFGGRAHFERAGAVNFQDFVHQYTPDRRIYSY